MWAIVRIVRTGDRATVPVRTVLDELTRHRRFFPALPLEHLEQIAIESPQHHSFTRAVRDINPNWDVMLEGSAEDPTALVSVQPVVTPARRVDAEQHTERERLAELARRRGVRPRAVEPATELGGDIEMDGSLHVRSNEVWGKASEAKSKGIKEVEREVQAVLNRMSVPPKRSPFDDLVDQAASFLVGRANFGLKKLEGELFSLTERYHSELLAFQTHVSHHQSQKLMAEVLSPVLAATKTEESRKERQKFAKSLSKVLGPGMLETSEKLIEESVGAIVAEFETRLSSVPEARLDLDVKTLTTTASKLETTHRALAGVKTNKLAALREQTAHQFREILSQPFVRELVVQGEYLVVRTNEVFLEHGMHVYPFGRFSIQILLPERKQSHLFLITGERATSMGVECQTPHVRDNGRVICWGDIREGVHKLYSEWDWPHLILILWQFLHSYTPHDCYRRLDALVRELDITPIPRREWQRQQKEKAKERGE